MPGKVPHLSTLILIKISSPQVSIKQNEKPGWKQKERGTVERGEEV